MEYTILAGCEERMFFLFSYPLMFFLPVLFLVVGVRLLARILRGSSKRRYTQVPKEEYLQRYVPDFFGERVGPLASGVDSGEARIFKLAYRLKGRLTVSDVVVETGLGVADAEALVQSLVDGVRVQMEVDERGMVMYEFPEIIARFESETPPQQS